MNAFTSTALLATTNLSTPAGDDAELIRVCAEHAHNLAVYNNDGDPGPMDAPDPLWDRYEATRNAISEAKPSTLEGMLAKARAAKAEAGRPDGSENPDGTPAARWAWDLVNDLLGGTAARRDVVSPDAALIALAERFIQHERAIQDWPCDALLGTPEDAVQEANQSRMCDVQHAMAIQLGTLRATTAEGIAARARCLAVHNADGAFSMEDPNTTTGRLLRWLMRDTGLLGGVATEPLPRSPDAELLETCSAFDALERAYIAAGGDYAPGSLEEDMAEAERARLSDAQDPLVDRICDLRAVTNEGQVARARSLALWDAELMKPQKDVGGWFVQAIVRDLLAASSSPPSTPDPDAALIAVCERGLQLNAGRNALRDQAALNAWRAGHSAEWQDILGDICGTRATTPAGRFAKGRFFSEALNGGEDDVSQSLLIDIDAEARRLGLVAPLGADVFPDADLLDKTAAFFSARAARPGSVGAEKIANTPECERYEASLEACFAAEDAIFRAAMALPACTMLGLRAKARLVKARQEHEDHVDSLLDDLLAGVVA